MSSIPAAPAVPDERTRPVAAWCLLGGVPIVALTLVAAGRLGPTGSPRWLAVAAVTLAVLTVGTAVGALVLRPRRAAALTLMCGSLLVAAAVLTGSAAVAVLVGGPAPAPAAAEVLTVVTTGSGEDLLLTLHAEMPGAAAGDLVRAQVLSVAPEEQGGTSVLAQQFTVAPADGAVPVALTAPVPGTYDRLDVLVESADRRCTASVRPRLAEAPVVSCQDR